MADLLSFFLQVKTSGEEEKSGFASGEECAQAAQWFLAQKAAGSLSQVDWVGLMTMGSIRGSDFQQDARAAFQQLQQLREQLLVQYRLPQLHLSMGMSQDYPLAIELGSDWVRIGSDIFSSAHSDI